MATESNPNSFVSVSLYVGDLDLDATEAQLYEKFSTCGQVVLVKLCRDKVTRQSLGYAYVNFAQPADAERALDTLNFEPLNGKPMRIMWSNRDPALRRSGTGNVFIKNLDKSIDNKSLYDTFSTFGNIVSCKIMSDENGSKGYGFVHFETQEAAENAIKNVNQKMLGEKIVYVGQFLPKQERSAEEQNDESTKKFTNIYVKNFDESVDDKKLEAMFEKFGEITSATVTKNEEGKSLCFGFVNFKNPEDAAKAVAEMHDKILDEDKVEDENKEKAEEEKGEKEKKKLYVSKFQKKSERTQDLRKKHEEQKLEALKKYYGVNLFVKNLDDKFDDNRLRKEFEPYGTITSAKIMNDQNGRSRGFGFVCFTAPEEAAKAVAELNGRIVGSKPLYVALAQRKDERRKILATKLRERISNNQYFNQQYSTNPAFANQQAMAVYAAYQNAVNGGQSRILQQSGMNAYQQVGANGAQQLRGNSSVPRWQNPNIYSQQQAAAAAAYFQAQRGQQPQQQQPYQTQFVRGNGYQMQQKQLLFNQNYAGNRYAPSQLDANNNYLQQVPKNDKFNKFKPSQGQQMKQPVAKNSQLMNIQGQEPLNISELLAAPPQMQKQLLGERLYQLINKQVPELAGKITGMLLEIDNAELLHMLESEDSLKSKVEEAVTVLNTHREKQQQQQQEQQAS